MPETTAMGLDSYCGILDACRTALAQDLLDSPSHDYVVRFVRRGKMLRPLLVLAATSAVGGNPTKGLLGARAIELLHAASLVHDDIIDGAAERRGLPAMHIQLGMDRALVIGDYLLLRSLALVTEDNDCDRATKLRVLATLESHAEECCRGQIRELELSEEPDLESEYLRVAGWKTGSQFAAAAAIGGILGEGDAHEVDALREYGANLGIAFQIEDDLADLTSDSQSLGKPAGNSLANGRRTLPLIYLDRTGSSALRTEFRRNVAERHDPEARVMLLRREGILEAVRAKQASFVETALAALKRVHRLDVFIVLHMLPFHVLEASRGKEAAQWT
jgi:geranylgeranyl pyrophosphate synthase